MNKSEAGPMAGVAPASLLQQPVHFVADDRLAWRRLHERFPDGENVKRVLRIGSCGCEDRKNPGKTEQDKREELSHGWLVFNGRLIVDQAGTHAARIPPGAMLIKGQANAGLGGAPDPKQGRKRERNREERLPHFC